MDILAGVYIVIRKAVIVCRFIILSCNVAVMFISTPAFSLVHYTKYYTKTGHSILVETA